MVIYLLEDRLEKILDFLQEITGTYISEYIGKNSFSGTLGVYSSAQKLIDIYNQIQTGNYEIAYQKEISFLRRYIDEIRFSEEDLFKLLDDCKKFSHILSESHTILKEFLVWNKAQRVVFKNYLFNNEFLKEEEKTEEFLDKFNYEWVDAARKSVNSKELKVFNFGNSSETTLSPGHTIPYKISDAFCISDDINICTKPDLSENDDTVNIRLSLKIDKILEFSYFVITVSYKDKVWIVTDRPEFKNPENKHTTRNPYRRREEAYRDIQLPYEILTDISEWRSKSRNVSKKDSSELYIKSIRDFLKPESKILLKLIVEELVYHTIPNNTFSQIYLYTDSLKLLGSDNMAENDENLFVNINKEKNDRRLEEIVYPEESLKAIVKIDPVTALSKYSDERNNLITYEEMKSNALWSVKEETRKQKQNILDSAYTKERIEKDDEELNKILFDNKEKIYEIMFSGDEVYMKMENEPFCSFGSTEETYVQISNNSKFETHYNQQNIIDYKKLDFSFKYIGPCLECGSEHPKYIQFKIFSYKQLCVMLGISRKDLPYTFQNYVSNVLTPYAGNTILDNVNPEYKIKDYRSRRFENCYAIGVPLNKSCFNKLMKKYRKFKKSLVIFNYKDMSFRIEDFEKRARH